MKAGKIRICTQRGVPSGGGAQGMRAHLEGCVLGACVGTYVQTCSWVLLQAPRSLWVLSGVHFSAPLAMAVAVTW